MLLHINSSLDILKITGEILVYCVMGSNVTYGGEVSGFISLYGANTRDITLISVDAGGIGVIENSLFILVKNQLGINVILKSSDYKGATIRMTLRIQ